MSELADDEELSSLTRFELVSEYMEACSPASPERRAALERELARRGLPLPALPPTQPSTRSASGESRRISRRSFLAYLLLLYPLTGPIYAWVYLLQRIHRRDFAVERRHTTTLTLISLVYVVAETLLIWLWLAR